MTDTGPLALIPPMPVDGRGDYARGYRAAVAAMRILAPGLDRPQMRQHAERHAVPPGHHPRTDYDHGTHDAFAKWLENDRAVDRLLGYLTAPDHTIDA